MAGEKCSTAGVVVLVLGTLLVGTISTVLNKLLFQLDVKGAEECESPHKFEKPYALALFMFIGESLCLLVFKVRAHRAAKEESWQQKEINMPLMLESGAAAQRAKVRPPLYYFLGFCLFDMTATIISGIGLKWVDASLYQMLRGGQVVFAACTSMILLKKRYTRRQWMGLFTVLVGLAVVGASGLLKAGEDKSTPVPTPSPTPNSTNATSVPSYAPSSAPSTWSPTYAPSADPTASPTADPTASPTDSPIAPSLARRVLSDAAPLYICHMHPYICSDQPGKCPICDMDLELAGPGGTCASSPSPTIVSTRAPTAAPPKEAATSSQILLGIVLIVISSALQGLQSVFEEKAMKSSEDFYCEPLELVGWEGVFGSIVTVAVLLVAQYIPGPDCGKAENSGDTIASIGKQLTIALILVGYTLNLTVFNFLGNKVSQVLSAIHRQFINAARTISIWIFFLIVHYSYDETKGESWSKWSFLQLAGFAIFLTGTYIYSSGAAAAAAKEKKSNDNA